MSVKTKYSGKVAYFVTKNGRNVRLLHTVYYFCVGGSDGGFPED